METNNIINVDCIEYMKKLSNNSVDLILTDIPYNEVTRESNGIGNFDRGMADILNFDLQVFLSESYRISKSSIIIFCGQKQMSEIFAYFQDKQKEKKGTVRQLIWEKTNPTPFNGQYVYLSGIENAIWFRKSKGTFNAHCKNTVFRYPIWGGKNRIHPTEKNHDLLKELILDNSNENDIVFDPCAGSGSTLLVAKNNNRKFLGCEINEEFFKKAKERLERGENANET